MDNQTYTWIARDGIKLFGQSWRAEKTRKSLIILVHGLGEHCSRYGHWAKLFTEKGYSVISLDLHGHGRSEGKKGHVRSLDVLLDDIDTLFEKELRQGFRLQTNYRVTKDIMIGLQSGYRFLKSDPEPSKNAYAYVSYSRIPGVNINATLTATWLETSYLNGKILGINLNRDLSQGKIQTGLGYRYISYKKPENLLDITQNIAEASVSWQFHPKMSLSVNYEGTFEDQNRYNRIYLQVRRRF